MKKTGNIIINFCPTGMLPTRKQTPFVPISPKEIIEEVHKAFELGITIAHLHAREEDETPSWRKNVYREIFEGVRRYCPSLIICGSTSGRTFPDFSKRSAVIELRPDMCSLTLGSLNFYNQVSVNSPDTISALAEKMNEYGVHPELECFDLGMINYGKYLARKEIIHPPFYWNLLFGNVTGFQANLSHISAALSELDEDYNFVSLAGFGKDQLVVNAIAIAAGYGVRVGLEDNTWFDNDRTIKASNISLLQRIHSLLQLHEKKYMKPEVLGKLGFYNAQNIYTGL